ncbi:hypothetical protein G9A89_012601 [Geosiphon pyriformis]|nr:hypothetical protein G9A89_012601 [Geosiphon pyriformis]
MICALSQNGQKRWYYHFKKSMICDLLLKLREVRTSLYPEGLMDCCLERKLLAHAERTSISQSTRDIEYGKGLINASNMDCDIKLSSSSGNPTNMLNKNHLEDLYDINVLKHSRDRIGKVRGSCDYHNCVCKGINGNGNNNSDDNKEKL